MNEHKRRVFWTHNYPFGRRNVRTQDMIDLDEAGFKIESTNPNFGKTVTWMRCYLEGEYNREKKVNCMMAISAIETTIWNGMIFGLRKREGLICIVYTYLSRE